MPRFPEGHRDAVEDEFSVRHDLASANQMNPGLNGRKWNGFGVFGHECQYQAFAVTVNGTMLAARPGWTLHHFSASARVARPL
jgi:hypothetical protein